MNQQGVEVSPMCYSMTQFPLFPCVRIVYPGEERIKKDAFSCLFAAEETACLYHNITQNQTQNPTADRKRLTKPNLAWMIPSSRIYPYFTIRRREADEEALLSLTFFQEGFLTIHNNSVKCKESKEWQKGDLLNAKRKTNFAHKN
jgi:hypothetical protein